MGDGLSSPKGELDTTDGFITISFNGTSGLKVSSTAFAAGRSCGCFFQQFSTTDQTVLWKGHLDVALRGRCPLATAKTTC